MALFKCKMCGGDLVLTEGNPLAECEYCGSLQTVPSADNEKKLAMFGRAGRLLRGCEFDKAAGVYESIVSEFPEEAEAYWGLVLCKYGIEYVDDPATKKKIPTCHRSSFDSVLDDDNLEQVLENADAVARKVYRDEARQIEELRKAIIEVSGKEEPYDIFICYKETAADGGRTIDSVIAEDVYNALTEKGYRVFFSRITLEDKLGQAYEPYIFAALHSAKVMLAIGTDYEHYNAVWVKNEWSRFLQLIAAGEKKALIPCYKGIDAYDMPKEFAHLQAQDMGKVGAMHDLLRGIDKLISPSEKEVPVATASVDIIEVTLKKAYEFLNEEDWDSAKKCLDTVIGYDPHNVSALIGCLMLKLHIPQEKKLADHGSILENEEYYQQAIRFADKETKLRLEEYNRSSVYNCAMAESKKLGGAKAAIRKFESISGWRDADEQVKILKQKQKKAKARRRSIAAIAVVIALIAFYLTAGAAYQSTISDFYAGNISAEEAYAKLSHLEWRKKPDEFTKILINMKVSFEAYPGIKDTTEIMIPDGITNIGDSMFYDCATLTSITIPSSVTSIGSEAFSGCNALTSITIPSSVTSIGAKAFYNCTNLVSVTIPNSVTNIGDSAFYNCASMTSITLPNSITNVGAFAFRGCSGLTSVTIPDSVTNIGDSAFFVCTGLTSVAIPDGVTSIGNSAFRGCSGLTSVTIPDSVTSIGDSAFRDCSSLTSITIPSNITSIGETTFKACRKLTSVMIPDGVTQIGKEAFSWCSDLVFVHIPSSVASIGRSAFSNCENLQIYCATEKKPLLWDSQWAGIDEANIHWGVN